MRSRGLFRAVTSLTALATATGIGLTGAASADAAPPGAPALVTPGAAHGGAVVITLKDQLKTLHVRGTQGRERKSQTRKSQAGVIDDISAHGGSHITQLVSVNAVAAHVSAAEIARLRRNPAVASIVPDSLMRSTAPSTVRVAKPAKLSSKLCPTDPGKPLLEPEALTLTKDRSRPDVAGMASHVATGKGVIVGLTGINGMAGNPNLIRPNGQHVVIDSPTPNADNADFGGGGDEWYGDASSIAAQGTVTYDFAKELPYSACPAAARSTSSASPPAPRWSTSAATSATRPSPRRRRSRCPR